MPHCQGDVDSVEDASWSAEQFVVHATLGESPSLSSHGSVLSRARYNARALSDFDSSNEESSHDSEGSHPSWLLRARAPLDSPHEDDDNNFDVDQFVAELAAAFRLSSQHPLDVPTLPHSNVNQADERDSWELMVARNVATARSKCAAGHAA